MASYIEITDSEIDPESPGTTSLFTRIRDNPIAIAEGATGAPRIAAGALDVSSGLYSILADIGVGNAATEDKGIKFFPSDGSPIRMREVGYYRGGSNGTSGSPAYGGLCGVPVNVDAGQCQIPLGRALVDPHLVLATINEDATSTFLCAYETDAGGGPIIVVKSRLATGSVVTVNISISIIEFF